MCFESINKYFDKIFVVTIQRNEDRRKIFNEKFVGLDYCYFYGVDGYELTTDQLVYLYDDVQAFKNIERSMHIGEIGCTLSHRLLFEHILKTSGNRFLILEDDIIFEKKHVEIFNDFTKQVPTNWELCYFGYGSNFTLNLVQKIKYLYPHIKLRMKTKNNIPLDHYLNYNFYSKVVSQNVSKAGWHFGSYAYAIKKTAASQMVTMLTPITTVIDDGLSYLSVGRKIDAFICVPPIFSPRENVTSSIWNY